MGYKSKFTGKQIDARLDSILDSSYLDKIYDQTLSIEDVNYLKEQSLMRPSFFFDGNLLWQVQGNAPMAPNGVVLETSLRLENSILSQDIILVDIYNDMVIIEMFEEWYNLSELKM